MRSLVQNSLHTENARTAIQQFSVHVSMEKRKILFYKENNLKCFKVFVCLFCGFVFGGGWLVF